LAMTQVVEKFFVPQRPAPGVSKLVSRGNDVVLGEGVSIWPFVTLDDRVSIGRGTTLYSNVFVGEGGVIGEDCVIYPNVTIREGVTIGNRVIIHSGTVVGSDGFGYIQEGGRQQDGPSRDGRRASGHRRPRDGRRLRHDRRALGPEPRRARQGGRRRRPRPAAHGVAQGHGHRGQAPRAPPAGPRFGRSVESLGDQGRGETHGQAQSATKDFPCRKAQGQITQEKVGRITWATKKNEGGRPGTISSLVSTWWWPAAA